MNDPGTNDQEELIRRALRGKISEEERTRFERRLREDSALRQQFEEERALERLLERAPKLPVPGNFTALVLQAVRKEQRQFQSKTSWFRFRFARVAVGMAVVVAAGLFGLLQYREAEREQIARSVSAFTEVASVIGSEQTRPGRSFRISRRFRNY